MCRKIILLTIALTALGLYVGCGGNSSSPPQAGSPTVAAEPAKTVETKVEEHAHSVTRASCILPPKQPCCDHEEAV